MSRCIHDMEEGTCSFCAMPPAGVPEIVYVTKFGKTYHRIDTCSYMESGHEWADSRGQDNHPPFPIKWTEARDKYFACLLCFKGPGEVTSRAEKRIKKKL